MMHELALPSGEVKETVEGIYRNGRLHSDYCDMSTHTRDGNALYVFSIDNTRHGIYNIDTALRLYTLMPNRRGGKIRYGTSRE